jgi:hypothetical protein
LRFQQTDFYCGPAALQNALLVLRQYVTQRRIADLAGTTDADGTDEEGLKRAAVALGYGIDEMSFAAPGPAWEFLRGSLLAGRPVIVCVDRWSHWITAIGGCGPQVLVAEPARYAYSVRENGILVVNRDWFLRRWRAGRRVRGPGGPVYYGLAIGRVEPAVAPR